MRKVESTPSGSGAIRGQLNNSNATLYGSNPYFKIKTLLCPGMPFSHSAESADRSWVNDFFWLLQISNTGERRFPQAQNEIADEVSISGVKERQRITKSKNMVRE
ncbi:hypothetical protein U1Q18_041281 [Sarracenia purpurea var. burkii]